MKTKRPFTSEEFRSIYGRVPRLCVEVVIRSQAGILLTLRSIAPWKGSWHLPGGTVYFNEPLEKAAHRVAAEEVGLKIKLQKSLGYIEFESEATHGGFGCSVSIVFLAQPESDRIRLNAEASAAKFFMGVPSNIVTEHKRFLIEKNLLDPLLPSQSD